MRPTGRKVDFKTLQIITWALSAGVALFLTVTSWLHQNETFWYPIPDDHKPLVYIGVVFAGLVITSSTVLFKYQINAIDTNQASGQKLSRYITACITRYALLEGAALFNVVIFFISGSLINASAAVLIIILMVIYQPKRAQVMANLNVHHLDNLNF